MPLIQSAAKSAFSENVSREVNAGKPQKQAVAIAYSVKRKNDMSDQEKLDQIVSQTDALTKRMDAFMARRAIKRDADRRKMADARTAMNQRKVDAFEEASHPRNAGGIFTTGEGEEGKEDTQMNPGLLSKRNPL